MEAGLLDLLVSGNQNQQQGIGRQDNLLSPLHHTNNNLFEQNNNRNNFNHRPFLNGNHHQIVSQKEDVENLKDRLAVLNQKLLERNKQQNNNIYPNNQNTDIINNVGNDVQNNNKHPSNQNTHPNNNVNNNHKPDPSENENTNGDSNENNINTDSNINANVIHKINWKKLTKSKFYYQVQPVVPEDEREILNETVYYED